MKFSEGFFVSVVIASLALSGCGAKESEQVTAPVVSAISVEADTASNGEVETNYVYSGKTAPVETANVFSLVNGMVDEVYFDIGDRVNAGDVLFTMDTEAIENSLNTARASYQAALANVEVSQTNLDTVNGASMQMQLDSLKNTLETAQMSCEMAQIAYDTAKTSYDNTKVLYEQGFVSQVDMDSVSNALTKAQNDLTQAQNGLAQAQSTYDITSGDLIEENTEKAMAGLKAAQAQANSAAAQIASAEKSLRDAKITSPINGVVTAQNITAGTLLSTSSVPFIITDSSTVIVKVSVSEQIINRLEKGQSVDVKIAAVSDSKMEGKIKTINPAANQSGTYDVEIEIPNNSGNVKTGMFAEVSFVKAKGYNAIVVARDAVISKNNEEYVFVVENGAAVKKNVVMGVDDGHSVQILKGIEEGELVIVKGQSYLNEGSAVNVVVLDGARTDTASKNDNAQQNEYENMPNSDAETSKGE
ncbi:MAG: efflux RND transporter periplasmic adaptor subunit [Firmicutes bacterium]|nr:efflux RND transporter periplasmic adaptor subunit [Bacillota bacterium]